MIGSVLMAVALAVSSGGSTEAAKKYQVKTLTVQVPESWQHSVQDGTDKFNAPTGEFFTLDVGAVQTAGMKAQVCVDKIKAALGAEGWQRQTVGSNPAARRVNVDNATEDGAAKVMSITYIGCDGKTTWSLIFSGNEQKKDELFATVTKIAGSIAYSKGK